MKRSLLTPLFLLCCGISLADEIKPCEETDPRDLLIGIKVDCLWDAARSGVQFSKEMFDACEKDRSAIKRFMGECK